MKELEWYLGETYSNSCHTAIMTEKPSTLPEPEMSKIIPDTGVSLLKTDAQMTYLENNNIDESIHQKLRKKDVYETDTHKIYNIIVG